MKKVKRFISYVISTLIAVFVPSKSLLAHTESQGWGHHMPMMDGFWGWGPMVLFWITGVLLVALLAVTLVKTLRD